MTISKSLSIAVISLCLTIPLASTVSCGPDAATISTWQESSLVLQEEINRTKQDLIYVEDPVERARLEGALSEMERMNNIFLGAIQSAVNEADAPWAWLETAALIAAGLFPPAGIAIPIIRTLRRQRAAIFQAVDAGGGVVNAAAAKSALATNPAAVAALAKHKANGKNGEA